MVAATEMIMCFLILESLQDIEKEGINSGLRYPISQNQELPLRYIRSGSNKAMFTLLWIQEATSTRTCGSRRSILAKI